MTYCDALVVVVRADAVLGHVDGRRRRPRSRVGSWPRAPGARTRSPSGATRDAVSPARAARRAEPKCACTPARRRSRRRGTRRGRRPPCRSREPAPSAHRPPGSAANSCHRQRQADGEVARARLDRVVREAVRRIRFSVALRIAPCVARAGREDAEEIADQGDDVRLVDRAADPDAVAEVGAGALAEAREPVRRSSGSPSRRRDAAHRGVVKWWNVTTGCDAVARGTRRSCAGSGRARCARTRRPRARSATTRSRTGTRRSRGRRAARCPRGSGRSGRTRRRRARRTAIPACAPTPTSRCSSCRLRPGARPSPCPRGSRRET